MGMAGPGGEARANARWAARGRWQAPSGVGSAGLRAGGGEGAAGSVGTRRQGRSGPSGATGRERPRRSRGRRGSGPPPPLLVPWRSARPLPPRSSPTWCRGRGWRGAGVPGPRRRSPGRRRVAAAGTWRGGGGDSSSDGRSASWLAARGGRGARGGAGVGPEPRPARLRPSGGRAGG